MQIHLSSPFLSRLVLAILFGFTSLGVLADDLDEGIAAYQQQDYQAAFTAWNRAAQQGDADAEYNLGQLYRLGQGVQTSYLTAQSHYIKAAEKNHPLAELQLGTMFYSGKLGPDHEQDAFYWLEQAAENNNAQAQWMVGIMSYNGQGTSQNTISAYSWLTLASEQQHTQAMLDQAKLKKGLTAKQLDLADALTTSFKQKQTAMSEIQQQEKDAFYWLHLAAEKGDSHAQLMVGDMLMSGQGAPQDLVAAYSWFTLANEQLEPKANLKQAELKPKLSVEQLESAEHLTTMFKQKSTVKRPAQQQKVIAKMPVSKLSGQTTLANETQYRVQVGSFKTQQQANTALTNITKKASTLLFEQSSTITEPNPNSSKADFYRVQFGAFTDKNDADRLCQQLVNNKQACFVVKVLPQH
jgi:TPR repeat protein